MDTVAKGTAFAMSVLAEELARGDDHVQFGSERISASAALATATVFFMGNAVNSKLFAFKALSVIAT